SAALRVRRRWDSLSARCRSAKRSAEIGLDPDQRRGEADGGSVVAGEFVRAHRDAAPLLETVEAAFYDVASLVAFLLLVAESDRPARLLAAVRDLVVPLGDGRRDPPVAEPGAVRP